MKLEELSKLKVKVIFVQPDVQKYCDSNIFVIFKCYKNYYFIKNNGYRTCDDFHDVKSYKYNFRKYIVNM